MMRIVAGAASPIVAIAIVVIIIVVVIVAIVAIERRFGPAQPQPRRGEISHPVQIRAAGRADGAATGTSSTVSVVGGSTAAASMRVAAPRTATVGVGAGAAPFRSW